MVSWYAQDPGLDQWEDQLSEATSKSVVTPHELKLRTMRKIIRETYREAFALTQQSLEF